MATFRRIPGKPFGAYTALTKRAYITTCLAVLHADSSNLATFIPCRDIKCSSTRRAVLSAYRPAVGHTLSVLYSFVTESGQVSQRVVAYLSNEKKLKSLPMKTQLFITFTVSHKSLPLNY